MRSLVQRAVTWKSSYSERQCYLQSLPNLFTLLKLFALLPLSLCLCKHSNWTLRTWGAPRHKTGSVLALSLLKLKLISIVCVYTLCTEVFDGVSLIILSIVAYEDTNLLKVNDFVWTPLCTNPVYGLVLNCQCCQLSYLHGHTTRLEDTWRGGKKGRR